MSEAHAEFFKAIKAQLYALQNQVDTLEKEFNSAVAECTYFCLREVVVELGSYGTPEWSVMLTSTNTYPYMRVRSKGKPAPNGVYIINEIITKMSVRVNYV
ncbi:hypothetical protein ACEPPN_001178 [Leptodophora sp. 'Broadleaf-Isolate-01']